MLAYSRLPPKQMHPPSRIPTFPPRVAAPSGFVAATIDHGRAHRGRPRRVGLDRACAPAWQICGLSPIHSRLQMLPRCLRWLYPDPIVLDRLFLEPDQQRNGWQRDLDFRWRRCRGVCRGASALFADLHEQLSIRSINW